MKKIPAYAVLIVTYNGQTSIIRLIRHLLDAESTVPLNILIVDNASEDDTISCITEAGLSNVKILKNAANLGLGSAFNQGMDYFKKQQVEWVLILDQDSFVTKEFFKQFEQLFTTANVTTANVTTDNCPISDIAAICSNALSENSCSIEHRPYLWNGHEFYNAPDDIAEQICHLPVVASAISSGTFYKIDTVLALDGFKEAYFIDFIDHEFHLRLLKHGEKMLWNKSAIFYHNLGTSQQKSASEVWIEHPPFRYYYMARNMAHGLYTYGGVQGLWLFLKTIPTFLKNIYRFSKTPWTIIAYIVIGLFHAAIGRMGKR